MCHENDNKLITSKECEATTRSICQWLLRHTQTNLVRQYLAPYYYAIIIKCTATSIKYYGCISAFITSHTRFALKFHPVKKKVLYIIIYCVH